MDRALFRSLFVGLAVAAVGPSFLAAADDPLRDEATKLNRITGKEAANKRVLELVKDEANTKKLLAVALQMVKEDKKPLNYNACIILAKAAHLLKDTDSALTLYGVCRKEAEGLKADSKIVEVFEAVIDLHIRNNKYDKAIEVCKEFLGIDSGEQEGAIEREKPFVMERLVLILARQGKIDDALKLTDAMLEQSGNNFYFVRLKGDVLREAEKYGDAADAYLDALEKVDKSGLKDEDKKPFADSIRYVLSGVYVDMKQIDKATEQLETLMKAQPNNATFLNDLGFIWADHDMKLDEAEQLIRKAIDKDREARKKVKDLPKLDVDNAAYLDSLGWVLYKKKNYAEAKKYLQDATKLKEGQHIEILDHLADVHMALGEKAEAIKVWKNALQQEPQTRRERAQKKEIERKLAEAAKK